VDLVAIGVLNLVFLVLVYAVPFDPFRVALALAVVLFFPGWSLISTLFPQREPFAPVERIALGLGLSIAMVPLFGIALHMSPWGIRPTSIIAFLTIWNLTWAAAAWLRRRRTMPEERAEVRWGPVWAWVRKPRRPFDFVVGALLVSSALAMVGVIAWRIQNQPLGKAYTEFYVLGAEWMLQDYPSTLRVGDPQEFNVGIVNHEGLATSYSIKAFLTGSEVGSVNGLTLEDEEAWRGTVTVTPTAPGDTLKLEFYLYRDPGSEVYHDLHLYVDVLPP
jgi:uncharacterized membrane protein